MPFQSFNTVDPNFFFNGVGPYPGSGAFADALRYYQQNLLQNDAGGGQAGLAAGQAASGPAKAYQGATAAPSAVGNSDYAAQSFSDLLGGQTAARGKGREVQSQTRNADVGGAADTAGAYGSSISGALQGQLATDRANQQNQMGILGDVMSGVDLAAGIGSEIAAPGNPFGLSTIAGGLGKFGTGFSPGLFSSLGFNTGVPQFGGSMSGTGMIPPGGFGSQTGPFSLMQGTY